MDAATRRVVVACEQLAAGETSADQATAQQELESAMDAVEIQLHEDMLLLEAITTLLSPDTAAIVRESTDRLADALARARQLMASADAAVDGVRHPRQ
jgi:hypothetical protein